MRCVAIGLSAWLGLMVGCAPADLDLTGKRCNPEHRCGDGYVCVADTCQRALAASDAGVDGGSDSPNLLPGGDLEPQAQSYWALQGGGDIEWDVAGRQPPSRGVRLLSGINAATFTHQRVEVSRLPGPGFYCVSGWSQVGFFGPLPLTLEVLEGEQTAPLATVVMATQAEWTRVSSGGMAKGTEPLLVRLKLGGSPPEAISVDDIHLWRSGSGNCSEP